jgi:hypothetical protein
MKQRLNNESHQESEPLREHSGKQEMKFESEEDLLRFDAAQTEVPAQLRERLRKAVSGEKASLPWWKRWFQ